MMVTRITSTTRATDKPPPYSPFNFGINAEWYEKNKDEPTYQVLLRTWGHFDDPPGFGDNAESSNPASPAAADPVNS